MKKLKQWARELKTNIYALYLASRNTQVPLLAKIIIGIVVAYALSPVDLIPDFIPIIGYLDDLILLPLGICLAIRLIPNDVWRECQAKAEQQLSVLPHNKRAAFVIVLIWLCAMVGFICILI